jgi:hypothetical protein
MSTYFVCVCVCTCIRILYLLWCVHAFKLFSVLKYINIVHAWVCICMCIGVGTGGRGKGGRPPHF